MKQTFKLKHWMALLLALFIAGSCTDDDFGADRWVQKQPDATGRFTIAEAKQAFESYYAAACQSRCESDTREDNMSDDDFTPLWDAAVSRDQESCSFMTVPIATHKLLRIADIRNGKEHPQRLAVVKEEMHFVKNYELNMVVPTMKTIIPLDGSDVTTKGVSPKNALCIYRLLSGEVLNYQLIRNGREVFHTYPGEEQFSYEAKMEEIDRELDGLSLIVSTVYTFSGENENDISICGHCGGAHPNTTICEVVITNCAKCGARIQGGVHYCPNQTTTCGRCGASYNPSYGHSCPNPNYCSTCGQSYTGYHYCPGPSPIRCNSCGQYYVGSHTCTVPGQVCSKCNTYYVGSHSCLAETKICNSCGQVYTGSTHTSCIYFCAICGTTPCKNKCSNCGKNHCSTNHNPIIPKDSKLQEIVANILEILKDTPLSKVILSYHDKSQMSFLPKENQDRIVIGKIIAYSDGTYGFMFTYEPSEINRESSFSKTIILMHELYHIYTIDRNGLYTDPNNPNANNNRDHYNMANDPDYVKWLKQVVPGRTDDYYNNLKYSGTMGSPVFENLPEEEQRKLNKFFKKNKLKNQ